MNDKYARSLTLQRVVLTVLSVVLGIVLIVLVGMTVYAGYRLNRTDAADTQQIQSAPAEGPMTVETPLTGFAPPQIEAAEVDFGSGPLLEIGGGKIVNILLVGQDSAAETGARSDTMILCSFNKEKNTVMMVSFLRDLYVRIPGYGKDRINAAFSFGGVGLLNQTITENFGVQIHGNVQVDFKHFRKIIDRLGGVSIELTPAEVKYMNKHLPDNPVTEGVNLLSGKQALTYARNRYDVDGDFSRTNRQRKLLSALIDAYKSKKLTEMLALVNDVLPMISTDISKGDLTAYAVTLFPMLESAEIQTLSIPISGGYYNADIDGKSVLVPNLEKNKEALAECISE